MQKTTLGTAGRPSCILYLPNPPEYNPEAPLDIARLIEDNGNHWRKILTILAKLQCASGDWRKYRDQNLLRDAELICFADNLLDIPNVNHLVAGKASWERMGFQVEDFIALDEHNRIFQKDRIFLTPYPDYRQFPNQLIELLQPRLSATY